jgi:protein gp37
MWFGFSVSNQKTLEAVAMSAKWLPLNTFISIEPLQDEINLTKISPTGVDAYLDFISGGQYWFMGGDENGKKIKWAIIGAETGNHKNKVIPKRKWIENIVCCCRYLNVPVFLKNNLAVVWGEPLYQEYPW